MPDNIVIPLTYIEIKLLLCVYLKKKSSQSRIAFASMGATELMNMKILEFKNTRKEHRKN